MNKQVEGWVYTGYSNMYDRWAREMPDGRVLSVDHNLQRRPAWEYRVGYVAAFKPLVNRHARTIKARLEYALTLARLEG